MADGTSKPIIFISYSHKDKLWLEYIASHFGPAVRHDILKIWYDKKLNGGDELNEEISKQLNTCDLCVLLVSRNSLDSDYIMNTEMPRIRGRKVRIFPIVVTRTTTWVVEWLDKKLLRPEDGKPLQAFKLPARDDQMERIISEIVDITTPKTTSSVDAAVTNPSSATQ